VKRLADAIAAGEKAYESGHYVSQEEAKERLSRWFK
jgi:predicted transcriptional regulator